jgi:hypothetical protein
MSTKWWKRLAGCIAIKLAAAAGAADFQYQAGTASFGQARAVVFEDRRGNRAALAEIDAPITLATADFIALQAVERYAFARETLLIRGAASGDAKPADLLTAIGGALAALEPAVLRFGAGQLSVTAAGGQCRASIDSEGALRFNGCLAGEPVRSPLGGAFRVVEPEHGLRRRDEVARVGPLQVVAFGSQVVMVGLAGNSCRERFRAPGIIAVPYANDSAPLADCRQASAGVLDLLRRVGAPSRFANRLKTR